MEHLNLTRTEREATGIPDTCDSDDRSNRSDRRDGYNKYDRTDGFNRSDPVHAIHRVYAHVI